MLYFLLSVASLVSAHKQDPSLAKTVPAPARMIKYPRGLPLDNTPGHFHLSFNAGATGMTIMWETDSATTTDVCNYGTSSTSLTSSATGFQRTYGDDSFTGVSSHIVNLSGLSAFTRYYYSCGDPNIAMSDVFSFTTARAAGDQSQFTFAFIGDAGIKKSNGVFTDMGDSKDTFEFVHDVGDLGYADDYYLYYPKTTYEQVYAEWMAEIEPVASSMAFMGMPGNHESSCNEVVPFSCRQYQQTFTEYRTRWYFPGDEGTDYQNMWYSFDYGMIHFLNIDTETDYPSAPGDGYLHAGPFAPKGAQLDWLEADLQKAVANRDQVPWIIVSGHRPIISASGVHNTQANAFLDLLTKYDVDLYLSGHEHLYERFYPLDTKGNACATNYASKTGCVTYIVNGDGGNQEGNSKVPSGSHPNMAASCDTEFGWNRVTVYNSTTMYWEFVAETDTGPSIIDTFYFYKQY
jgi:hypothetical protein